MKIVVIIFVSSLLWLGCMALFHYHSPNYFAEYFIYNPDKGFTFQLRACKDAFYGLYPKDGKGNDEPNLVMMGAIGLLTNNISYYVFRNKTKGEFNMYKKVNQSPISCTEFRPFWIQTTTTSISIGNGQEIGESVVLTYNYAIGRPNKISFSNPISSKNYQKAEWIFDKLETVTNTKWTKQTEYLEPNVSNKNDAVSNQNETVPARSKIRCAALCTETVWCQYFKYSRENKTCYKASAQNQEKNIYLMQKNE